MIRKTNSSGLTSLVALAITLSVLGLLTWLAVAVWPAQLLAASGINFDSNEGIEHLRALSDIRTSLMTGLAGLAAASIAFAALWQANGARVGRNHQREIDWVNAYAAASSKLTESSGAAKFAGIIALEALIGSGTSNAGISIRGTLAEFVRTRALHDPRDQSLHRAMNLICDGATSGTYSLAGATISDMNMAHLLFRNIDLTSASVRNSKLNNSQRELISSNKSIDTGGVEWVSS